MYSEVKFKTSSTKLQVSKSFSMEHVYVGNMDKSQQNMYVQYSKLSPWV